jgi:hypothetical protein
MRKGPEAPCESDGNQRLRREAKGERSNREAGSDAGGRRPGGVKAKTGSARAPWRALREKWKMVRERAREDDRGRGRDGSTAKLGNAGAARSV